VVSDWSPINRPEPAFNDMQKFRCSNATCGAQSRTSAQFEVDAPRAQPVGRH
jgi:hypothetical protein